MFALQLRTTDLPAPTREHAFHPLRKWRFDFAWPTRLLAVEIDGAIWTRGRHMRAAGFQADCEKRNEAQLRGWCVLTFTAEHVRRGYALAMVQQALHAKT